MTIRNVLRIDRNPANPDVWRVQLECGHGVWKQGTKKPTVKQLRCETCEEERSHQW
jgi:hypothetical protein